MRHRIVFHTDLNVFAPADAVSRMCKLYRADIESAQGSGMEDQRRAAATGSPRVEIFIARQNELGSGEPFLLAESAADDPIDVRLEFGSPVVGLINASRGHNEPFTEFLARLHGTKLVFYIP